MAGMRDVAKAAGVSLSTVSIVLGNNDKFVSQAVKEKVLKAVKETGYKPVIRKKAEKTIAVILPSITSSFFSNLFCGIEDAVAGKDYTLLVGDTEFQFEKEKNYIDFIRKQNLYGVLIDTTCPIEREKEYFALLSEKFIERNIPVAFLERNMEDERFCSVYVDHYGNANKAISHLIHLGHRKIAHISGIEDNPLSGKRLDGYRDTLEQNGISYDEELVCGGDFTPNSGYIAMKKLLGRRNDFTAVFAANDQMAIGAMKAILSEGKRIPEDIAVVGIDNLSVSSMVTPALTTINVPTFHMGRMAVKMLMNANEHNNIEKIEADCNLIVRKSTDISAGSEWELFGW